MLLSLTTGNYAIKFIELGKNKYIDIAMYLYYRKSVSPEQARIGITLPGLRKSD